MEEKEKKTKSYEVKTQEILIKAKSLWQAFQSSTLVAGAVRSFKECFKPKNPLISVSYILLISIVGISLAVNIFGYIQYIISGGYSITIQTPSIITDVQEAFRLSTIDIIYQPPTIEILCFLTTAALLLGHISDLPEKDGFFLTALDVAILFFLWLFCTFAPSTSWLWFAILAIWLYFIDPERLGKYAVIGLLVAYLGIPVVFFCLEYIKMVFLLVCAGVVLFVIFKLMKPVFWITNQLFPPEREDGIGGNASTIVAEKRKQKDGTEVIFVNSSDKVYVSTKEGLLDTYSFGDTSSIRRANWGSSSSEWLCPQSSYKSGKVRIVDKQTGKDHPILPTPPKGYE